MLLTDKRAALFKIEIGEKGKSDRRGKQKVRNRFYYAD
ncbi:MAG: hypothetical protein JWP78_1079 [Mucilaginibacter sp.]|nr:hypothetical protein [Mucilaginibacter sp.]